VLVEHGIDPAGKRRTTWKAFVRAHWGAIPATDLCTIEVVTWQGLVRHFVLFVIDLRTWQVEIEGITRSPTGLWMSQIARNLTDVDQGFLVGSRYLIHDRDPLFTSAFAATLRSSGVEPIKLPHAART